MCLILKQGAIQNEMCNNTKWLTYRLTNEWKEEQIGARLMILMILFSSFLLYFSALFGHQSICCFNSTFYCSSFSFSHNKYRFAAAADFPSCRSVYVVPLLLIATAVICLLLSHTQADKQTRLDSVAVAQLCFVVAAAAAVATSGPATLANFRTSIIWLGFQHYLFHCATL